MSETETAATTEGAQSGQEPKTFSLEYVQELRQENAAHRTSKGEAVESAKNETRAAVVGEYEPQLAAKDSQISELSNDLAATKAENLKLRAVLGSEGVAASDVLELASLVQGNDDESISESVKRVLSVYGKAEKKDRLVDPSQGSGSHIPLNGNPLLDMLKSAVGG